jgi:hypothetical protein
MERSKTVDETARREFAESEADMVESGGETTAAATGPAEVGAAKDTTGESTDNNRPVGADTLVKVAGEPESE